MLVLSMRGEDARRILAKRSQRILLGSSPRGAPRDTCVAGTPLRGPIITFSGYGSRLSARFAGVGRHDDCLGRARDEPAVAGNDRRLRSIVSGLLFTMNGATRTCDTESGAAAKPAPRLKRVHARLHLPRISHGAGAGVGGGVACELAVELGEQHDAVDKPIFETGGGEGGILRRRRAVDEEAR